MVGEAPTEGIVKRPSAERLPRLHGRLRSLHRDERGTALVEFALVAPLLFLLLFGVLDFSRLMNYYNEQTQLVGLGARSAAVSRNPADNTAASGTSIQTELRSSFATGQLRNNTRICIILPDGPGVGLPVTVTATYQFQFLPLIRLAVGSTTATEPITASQTERQEATTPTYTYSTSPSDPTGCVGP